MVDLHCHILPGLDDGAPSIDEALSIARVAEAAGVETVAATPHIREDYPFPLEAIADGMAELRSAIRAAGIAVEIVSGGELSLSKVSYLDDEQLTSLCLGDGPYLLVESPYAQAPSLLEEALFELQVRGFRPVLAHPERSPSFLDEGKRLERLVERGILCSVTAMSVTGTFGTRVRDFTQALFAAGLVHNIASDSHDATRRAPGFAAALTELKDLLTDAGKLHWFVDDAARAVLEGLELPPGRPTLTIPRAGWWRRRETERRG